MRTKRARRWRQVFFHRSTWAVSPVSRAYRRMLVLRQGLLRDTPLKNRCREPATQAT